MRARPTLLALAFAATLWPAAHATDLLEVWRAALAQDPEFAAARAGYAAGQARQTQADALWRPAVTLQAGVGVGTAENAIRGAQFSAPGFGQSTGVNFDTSVTGGTATRYALSLRQPLYSRERQVESEQLRIAAGMASQEWQAVSYTHLRAHET